MGFVGRDVVRTSATDADYGGQSYWFGTKFTAASGVTTEHLVLISETVKLFSGSYWISATATIEDTIEFSIVDQDGVVSAPGTVLSEYVSDMHVVPQERRTLQSGQTAEIPAGAYLKINYTSTGADSVEVLADWQWFK